MIHGEYDKSLQALNTSIHCSVVICDSYTPIGKGGTAHFRLLRSNVTSDDTSTSTFTANSRKEGRLGVDVYDLIVGEG